MRDIKESSEDILVIFDCDGVLVDSEAISSRVELSAVRDVGCQISMEEYMELALGRTDEDVIWAGIAGKWGVELPSGFGDNLRKSVAEAFEEELQPIAGARNLLSSLPYPKCVASAATSKRLKHTLSITGLAQLLAGRCFSGDMVEHSKPAPDLFLLAAETMGFSPRQCLVVEDSVNGVRGAVSAGMTVLGFTGASHCRTDLREVLARLGCREVFSDLKDLPGLIGLCAGDIIKV